MWLGGWLLRAEEDGAIWVAPGTEGAWAGGCFLRAEGLDLSEWPQDLRRMWPGG